MKISDQILGNIPEELRKKAEAASSPEELLSLAKEQGYELSPDMLESVSGGSSWLQCNSDNCKEYTPPGG
jgi:hypothetical protein